MVGKDNPPDLADLVPSGVPTLSDTVANAITSAPTEKVVEKDVLPAKKSVNYPGELLFFKLVEHLFSPHIMIWAVFIKKRPLWLARIETFCSGFFLVQFSFFLLVASG